MIECVVLTEEYSIDSDGSSPISITKSKPCAEETLKSKISIYANRIEDKLMPSIEIISSISLENKNNQWIKILYIEYLLFCDLTEKYIGGRLDVFAYLRPTHIDHSTHGNKILSYAVRTLTYPLCLGSSKVTCKYNIIFQTGGNELTC